MKLKNKIAGFVGRLFLFLFVVLGFQNCAQQKKLSTLDQSSRVDSATGSDTSLVTKTEFSVAAPTDAKQTLASMMSLLDLTPGEINMTEVNSEINYRRNLLVPKNEIAQINSPSIIATTSLAAVVCKQAMVKEKKGTKDLFKLLDFTQGPKAYGKIGVINTYLSLIDRLWMRKPTAEELQIISETVDEYFGTLDETLMGAAVESEKLAVFICTGLLASPESYLFQ